MTKKEEEEKQKAKEEAEKQKEKEKKEKEKAKKKGKSWWSKIWKAVVTALTATLATIVGNKLTGTKSKTSAGKKIIKNTTTAATRQITRDILGNLIK